MTVASIAAASGEETVPFDINRSQQPVFHALIDARSRYGSDRPALIDGDERVLTYEEIVRAALALGHALKRGTKAGESVGIMLPTGAASVIAFFAVSAYGRVPAMLNFTSGAAGLKSALKTAQIKRIVTAHRFVDLGKLDGLIDELAPDLRDRLSRRCPREAVARRQDLRGRRHIRAEPCRVARHAFDARR